MWVFCGSLVVATPTRRLAAERGSLSWIHPRDLDLTYAPRRVVCECTERKTSTILVTRFSRNILDSRCWECASVNEGTFLERVDAAGCSIFILLADIYDI